MADLCSAGAEFFSIDFWRDNHQFDWQTAVDGVFLSEGSSYKVIYEWLTDIRVRAMHSERMNVLRNHISYNFSSFDLYKENLMKLLMPHLPTSKRSNDNRGSI